MAFAFKMMLLCLINEIETLFFFGAVSPNDLGQRAWLTGQRTDYQA